MKLFKQLALVSAVAAASSGAFALEALSDDTMAAKTGQDGLTITIEPSANGITMAKLLIHDNDGLDSAATFAGADAGGDGDDSNGTTDSLGGTATAGAIQVDNLNIKGGTITATVDADAGAGGADPFINVGVSMAGTTTISMDKVSVGASGTYAGTGAHNGANMREATANKDILGALSLDLTDASMNVQMGAQPQGAMVLVNAQLTGGLVIDNLEVIDANGYTGDGNTDQGGLKIAKLTMTDTGSANMTLTQKIDIDPVKGLVITMNSPANGYYVYAEDVGFTDGNGTYGNVGTGTANNIIGDLEVVGLEMGSSTISISGH